MADNPFASLIGGGGTPYSSPAQLELQKELLTQLGQRQGPAFQGPGAWWGHVNGMEDRLMQGYLINRAGQMERQGRAQAAGDLTQAYSPFLQPTSPYAPGSSQPPSPQNTGMVDGQGNLRAAALTTGSVPQPGQQTKGITGNPVAPPGTINPRAPVPGANGGPYADLSPIAPFGYRYGRMDSIQGLGVHFSGDHHSPTQAINDGLERGYTAQYRMDRAVNVYRFFPPGALAQHIQNGTGPMGQGLSNRNLEGIEVEANGNDDVTDAQRQGLYNFAKWHSTQNGYDPTTMIRSHGELNPGHRGGEMTPTAMALRQQFLANQGLMPGTEQGGYAGDQATRVPLPQAASDNIDLPGRMQLGVFVAIRDYYQAVAKVHHKMAQPHHQQRAVCS
jgi:hypothetical protein